MNKTPTTLIIMDGFGLRKEPEGNAVAAADTPRLDQFFQEYAHTELSASGLDVGLPEGQMGNSEVGHTNIGAGRVVFQDLPRISKSIQDGTFFENPAYIHAMDACREHDSALHLMGLTQLRIAETEKYAHVTFFFNGGVETQFPGEDRVLVPSPKVATYDLQPEMSAEEVADKCVERIESGAYDVIILNFANCDMVGHTGVFDAAVKAVETVDACVGRVVDATMKMGGIAMITADHGNAEVMTQPDGSPMTAHTTNPVPFILCGAGTELRRGRLADIAPTILDVMGLAVPEEMDGRTLIVK